MHSIDVCGEYLAKDVSSHVDLGPGHLHVHPGDHDHLRKSELFTFRIHLIIVMIGWTGLAPWEVEFPFPGSLTSTTCAISHENGLTLKP